MFYVLEAEITAPLTSSFLPTVLDEETAFAPTARLRNKFISLTKKTQLTLRVTTGCGYRSGF